MPLRFVVIAKMTKRICINDDGIYNETTINEKYLDYSNCYFYRRLLRLLMRATYNFLMNCNTMSLYNNKFTLLAIRYFKNW